MITTDPEGKAIRQVTYYPFRDVARYAKGVALKPVTELPRKLTDHHGEQDTVTISAVYNKETGEVNIFVMNCDLEDEIELTLDLRSFKNLKSLGHTLLYDDDPFARNTFEEEYRIKPLEVPLKEPENGILKLVLKKHSWNVLHLQEQ